MLLPAYPKSFFSECLRRDLPDEPLFLCISRPETDPLRPIRGLLGNAAATPQKFYHRPCAGFWYRAAPKHPGRSCFESAARILALGTTPLAALETPQRHSDRLPAKPARARRQSDRWAPRMAVGPQ